MQKSPKQKKETALNLTNQIQTDLLPLFRFLKFEAMNVIDLRHEIISRIAGIEDVDFLNAIKTILDYTKNEPFIELSSDQENELLKASEEGKTGKFISQLKMDKKVEEWLTEK